MGAKEKHPEGILSQNRLESKLADEINEKMEKEMSSGKN